MLKFTTLISFGALVTHKLLATEPSMAVANTRALLAMVFVVLLLAMLRKEYDEFIAS
jgi:hypothetical protein